MQIDFFIHPDHAAATGNNLTQGYSVYLRQLQQVFSRSQHPVLIEGLDSTADGFSGQFQSSQRLRSASYHVCTFPVDRGEVSPKDWQKLVDIVRGGSSYRVHGTFFGQCTEGFAVQLFAYLNRAEHWHDWQAVENTDQDHLETRLRVQSEREGKFANSRIKYGVVLSPNNPVKIKKPGLLNAMLRKPFGNITYQLMDSQTQIHQM